MMYYWGNGSDRWWGWLMGFAVTIMFWAFIIFLIVTIMRSFATKDHGHALNDHVDAERVLARRFANGEIEEEEFHRRLDALRSHGIGGT